MTLRLFWTLQALDRHAAAHGWPAWLQARAAATLTAALGELPGDARVTRAELTDCGGPTRLLAPMLAVLSLLQDDPADPLPAMVGRRAEGLPEPMRADVAAWMTVLRHGSARTRPKSWKTGTEYSGRVRPLLLAWGRHYQHSRQITTADVRQTLDRVPAGSARCNAFSAVWSLFGFLRRDGRVLTDPTSRLHYGTRPDPMILPLSSGDYRRLTAAATSDLHRVVLLLAAVHAARPGAIRHLLLVDVDLTRRRLTLNGVPRPLDDLSAGTLTAWLSYRRQQWPLTGNPHLIVSPTTSLTDAPVSTHVLDDLFAGAGVSLDRLRMDRHLEEALAHGPDALHLVAVFGLSKSTGMRYAAHAKRQLEPPAAPASRLALSVSSGPTVTETADP